MRPTYAGVTATLALGVGGAYAAQKITSKAISPGAVKSKHIRNGHVKAADLGPDSVAAEKVADGSIGSPEIATGAVTELELQYNSVSAPHLKANSVGDQELALVGRKTTINVPAGGTGALTASCDVGEVAISGGGGFSGSPAGAILTNSEKANDGWFVEGRNTANSTKTLIAQAFCLAI
jgi:hypothetical protein